MDARDGWIPGDGDDFLDYADGDGAFAEWCRKVDRYAQRFLGMGFFEFEDLGEPVTYYCEILAPLSFVSQVLVPALEEDFGYGFIEELVADRVLWGDLKDVQG